MSQVTCPYCNNQAKLVSSLEIYFTDYGMVYACKPCNAWVGVHQGTILPKGTLANKELREWRKKAHAAFDPLWLRKLAIRKLQRGDQYRKVWARGSGYKWLAEQLGLTRDECHIGLFDIEMCKRVIDVCTNWRKAA